MHPQMLDVGVMTVMRLENSTALIMILILIHNHLINMSYLNFISLYHVHETEDSKYYFTEDICDIKQLEKHLLPIHPLGLLMIIGKGIIENEMGIFIKHGGRVCIIPAIYPKTIDQRVRAIQQA